MLWDTNAKLHHQWTVLVLAADRLDDELEHNIKTMYYSSEPYQVTDDLRKSANEARQEANEFYEQHAVQINKYLGKEICK